MSNKPSYRELNEQLNDVLSQLQSGDLDIDEALLAYEKGQKLVKQLQTYLDAAENKVKKVSAKAE